MSVLSHFKVKNFSLYHRNTLHLITRKKYNFKPNTKFCYRMLQGAKEIFMFTYFTHALFTTSLTTSVQNFVYETRYNMIFKTYPFCKVSEFVRFQRDSVNSPRYLQAFAIAFSPASWRTSVPSNSLSRR